MTIHQPGFGKPGESLGDSLGASLPRVFRPGRAVPADAVRPTRAEVNLANLRHNLRVLRRVAGPTPIWAVLKADGYGHGAKAVARTLERAGADGICVALVEEAIELREAGVRSPILVMGGYYGRAWGELIRHELTPVLHDAGQVEALAEEIRWGAGQPIRVHFKVDTGMSRLGVTMHDLRRTAQLFADHPEVVLDGLMTHFACADELGSPKLDDQLQRFEDATQTLASLGIHPRVRHAANSAALLRTPGAHFDLVRPGVALFGVNPLGTPPVTRDCGSDETPPSSAGELRPVMTVQSRVVALRDVPPGETVGYGATWVSPRESRIATIPIGYADGLSRALSNRGQVLIRGTRAPLVGIVSMDMAMIDVTDVPGASLGDEVVVLGTQRGPLGTETITPEEIAGHMDTIAWEVLTHISRRVPRFYREP